jgi:hypothetical protein
MNKYIDFSRYSDEDVLSMLREKQKEYIILIQSEKIAKMLLNFYHETIYTGKYHYRVNSEYYMLHERAIKKNLISDNMPSQIFEIPISSVISRLENSCDELFSNDNENYVDYLKKVKEIINKINPLFANLTISYNDGYLYIIDSCGESTLIDDDVINNLLENGTIKKKTLK